MVTEPTHIDTGTLDLVLTDARDLVRIRDSSPIGTSNHSALFIDIDCTGVTCSSLGV